MYPVGTFTAPGTTLAVVLVLFAVMDAVSAGSCGLGKEIPVFGCTPNVLGMVAACLAVVFLLMIGCCVCSKYRHNQRIKNKRITATSGGPSVEAPRTPVYPVEPPPYSQEQQPYSGTQPFLVRPYPGGQTLPEAQPVPGGPSTWTEPPPPYSPQTKVPL